MKRGERHSEESKRKMSEAKLGNPRSEETKRKIRENHVDNSGRNHGMFGKHHSGEIKRQISIAGLGRIHSEETKRKIGVANSGKNNYWFGKHRRLSDETCKKLRLATIAYIEKVKCNGGQLTPMYNINACKLIEEYGQLHGYNFQHAENGGEYYIKELGYFVDGYDKEKNVVIEYYEKRHKKTVNRDERRQKEIEDFLGCNFVILRA